MTYTSIRRIIVQYNAVIVLLLMVILAAYISDVFFTGRNITNILRQVTALGLISFGMFFVILTGGIDLSVGALMAVASVVFAIIVPESGFFIAALVAVGASIFLGAISGALVAWAGMAPFVATLAMMTIARGFALIIVDGSPVMIDDPTLSAIGSGFVFALPIPLFILLFFLAFFLLFETYSSWGRIIKAIGSNENAVLLTGINVPLYKFAVYCISGAMCGLAGIVATSRTTVGSPILGTGLELDAIAAVVIGGASLMGGRGLVFNVFMGVLILGLIGNIMNLLNVPGYTQEVVKGLIIILAVLAQGVDLVRLRKRLFSGRS
jgi:ribose transport system permease protein